MHISLQQAPKWLKLLITIGYILGLALMSLYVGWRLDRWIFAALRIDFSVGLTIFMGGFFLMSIILGRHYLVAGGPLRTYLCGISTFVMIWLSLGFLAADCIGFLTHQSSLAYVRSSGRTVLFAVLVLSVFSFLHRTSIRVTHENFPLTDGPCRMVLISDLHIGYYVGPKHIAALVKKINGLKPDFVVVSGDMINAGNTLECRHITKVTALLKNIKAPVYAVVGNHDPDVDDKDFQAFLRASNINLLEDQVFTSDQFQLVGRTTCTKPRKPLRDILPEPSLPEIVLDHDPQGIKEATADRANLVLCGHTHNGQVFPLNLFVRAVYTKAETYGRGQQENTFSFVTSGAGYFSMPMRLGSSCEIVAMELGKPEVKAENQETASEEQTPES